MLNYEKRYTRDIPLTTVSIDEICNIFSQSVERTWGTPELQTAWLFLIEGTADLSGWSGNMLRERDRIPVRQNVTDLFYIDCKSARLRAKDSALTKEGARFKESLQIPDFVSAIEITGEMHTLMMSVTCPTEFWEILFSLMRRLPDDRTRIKRHVMMSLTGLGLASFRYARKKLAEAGFYKLCNPPSISKLVHFRSTSKHGACLLLALPGKVLYKTFPQVTRAYRTLNIEARKRIKRYRQKPIEDYDPFEPRQSSWVTVDWHRKLVTEILSSDGERHKRVWTFAQYLRLRGEDLTQYAEGLCS